MDVHEEIDTAYSNPVDYPTTWQDFAAHARLYLEARGLSATDARSYVHDEMVDPDDEDLLYTKRVHRLLSTAKGLADFALVVDIGGLETLLLNKQPSPEGVPTIVPFSAMPESEFCKVESGGYEGHRPYRSNPYPSHTSHPDHDAE